MLTLSGLFGDLLESIFKREVQAKDSGKLLPGLGGLVGRNGFFASGWGGGIFDCGCRFDTRPWSTVKIVLCTI